MSVAPSRLVRCLRSKFFLLPHLAIAIAIDNATKLQSASTMSTDALKSLPLPTLDRPFGIELWPIFDKAYSAIFGYSPVDFEFVPGETTLSTLTATLVSLTAYYIIIFGGRELMKNRAPFVLNGPFMVHNLYLTLISGGLLVLFIEQILPTVARNGIFYAICSHDGGWTRKLVMLYYVSLLTGCESGPEADCSR